MPAVSVWHVVGIDRLGKRKASLYGGRGMRIIVGVGAAAAAVVVAEAEAEEETEEVAGGGGQRD